MKFHAFGKMAFKIHMRKFIIVVLIFLKSYKCQEIKSKIELNKCECPEYQIKNFRLSTCENVTDALYVRLWNSSTSAIEIIDINQSEDISITVTNLTCQNGFRKITSKRWDYLIDYNSGALKHQSISSTDEYCLEKYRDWMGIVRQYVKYCIKDLKIPLCCEEKQTLNEFGVCQAYDSNYNDSQILWPDNFTYEKKDLKCYNNHKLEPIASPSNSTPYSLLYIEKFVADNTQYCLGVNKTDGFIIKSCYHDHLLWNFSKDVTHVPHCCMENYAVNVDDNSYACIPRNQSFNQSELLEKNNFLIEPIQFQPRCPLFTFLQLTHNDKYELQRDGSIMSSRGERLSVFRYCLSLVKQQNKTRQSGFRCLKYPRTWLPKLSDWCLGISIVFSILTLIVHLGIKVLRNKVIGICIINQQTVTLFRNFAALVLYKMKYNSSNGCLTIGIFDIFCSLALFFWLNVICFDIWRILRGSEVAGNRHKDTKRETIIKYTLYGWGIPMIVTVTILAIQLISDPNRNYLGKTNFCERWQTGSYAIMSTTQFGLLLINVCFFIHLAIILVIKRRQNQKKITNKDEGSGCTKIENADIENLKLCLKLSLIMGIGWIFGAARVLIYKYTWDLSIYYPVRFCDIVLNDLQGLYIFIIFVLKKATLDLIKKELIPKKLQNVIRESNKYIASKIATTDPTMGTENRNKQNTRTTSNASNASVATEKSSVGNSTEDSKLNESCSTIPDVQQGEINEEFEMN